MSFFGLSVVLALVGQASGPAGPELKDAPSSVTLTGKVREQRSGPGGRIEPTLVTSGRRQYILHGRDDASRKELLRLSGTKIRVDGSAILGTTSPKRHIHVDRYQIIDVGGGKQPRVGILASLTLKGKARMVFVDERGQADLLPRKWGTRMARHVGAKMWMLGTKTARGFRPGRYAILRKRQEPNLKEENHVQEP